VLGDVADYADHDHAYEKLREAYLLGQRLCCPHKGFRDVGDGGDRPYEYSERDRLAERGSLLFAAGTRGLLLPAQVEKQIQSVEDDQHHCDTDAQVLQRWVAFGRIQRIEDGGER
jgi:hypothetical protein